MKIVANDITNDTDFLKVVLDAIEEGVVIHNKGGEIVAFNKKASSILGLSESQLLGKTSFDSDWHAIKANGADFPGEEHPVMRTLRTGLPVKGCVMGVNSGHNKPTTWLRISSKITEIEGEEYAFATFVNITAEFNAKKDLELIVSSLEDNLLEIDTDGNIISSWINDSNCFHLPQDYFLGKNLIHILPQERKSKLLSIIREVIETGKPRQVECKSPFSIGEQKWCMAKIAAVPHQKNRVSMLMTDITEEKRLKQELKESEERWMLALEGGKLGVWDWNAITNEVFFSPRWKAMLGYEVHEIGNTLSEWDMRVHPDDKPGVYKQLDKLHTQQSDLYVSEHRVLCKDGSYKWILDSGKVIQRDAAGSPLRIVGTHLDISESKKLFNELESKNRELDATSWQLKSKMEQIQEFNRLVAHNLRGPVANIGVLIRMFKEVQDEQKQSDILSMIEKMSATLSITLSELLSILNLNLNQDVLIEPCNIREIAGKVLNSLEGQIYSLEAQVQQHYEVESVNFSKVYLESVLYNLISNALKYRSLNESIRVKISTQRTPENKTRISVSDNGVGIDLNTNGKDLFKLHKIFHEGYDSKGVGLFITKNQVENLGGKIWAESEPGKGSSFHVEL